MKSCKRSKIGAQWSVILKPQGEATAENLRSDDVAWAVRVDYGATVQQISRGLLRV
jgi:hypothetical protein